MHLIVHTTRPDMEIKQLAREIIPAKESVRTDEPDNVRPLPRSNQSPLKLPPGPHSPAASSFIHYADWADEVYRQYAGVIDLPRGTYKASAFSSTREQREGDKG